MIPARFVCCSICLISIEKHGFVDSILVMLRAFFPLICWNAFRKVRRRGVGSSSREESTGTGPDREPAYLRALNLEAWTVASIAPMRSLLGVARSSQEWTDKSAFTGFDFTVGISVSSRSIDAEGIAT